MSDILFKQKSLLIKQIEEAMKSVHAGIELLLGTTDLQILTFANFHISFPCFKLTKVFKRTPVKVAELLAEILQKDPALSLVVKEVRSERGYLNFLLCDALFLEIALQMHIENYFADRPVSSSEKTMVEYSQPNTCKVFHVGHMRNAALGAALVNIYRALGENVLGVNYFGDDGAHIYKCIWLLTKRHSDWDAVSVNNRIEWLGSLYTDACRLLSLKSLTRFPLPGFVLKKVCAVERSERKGQKDTLVLSNNEKVPASLNGCSIENAFVAVKGGSCLTEVNEKKTKLFFATDFTENEERLEGKALVELGRFSEICKSNEEENTTVGLEELVAKRKREVEEIGNKIEIQRDEKLVALWEVTRKWSLDCFSVVYQWLGIEFDHCFSESEVNDRAKELVQTHLAKHTFVRSEGAVGCDLPAEKLGFALLLKSNGTSLYLTKDLALAEQKFGEFGVTKSVYVVDAAQTLHFQQLFAVLRKMGFSQVEQSAHVSYGQVVLASGKMSSREGNVIPFSALQESLRNEIKTRFLEDKQLDEDLADKIAISAIKYGMLKTDKDKNVVFEMEKWLSLKGNTGPYLLYTYVRTVSILTNLTDEDSRLPVRSFASTEEKVTLIKISKFWSVLQQAANKHDPSCICSYVYEICQDFNSWYTKKENSIKHEKDSQARRWKCLFAKLVANSVKHSLRLLGIGVVEKM